MPTIPTREASELYAPAMERIRPARDVIVYLTLPLAGSSDAPNPMTAARRFFAADRLACAGLIEGAWWTRETPI